MRCVLSFIALEKSSSIPGIWSTQLQVSAVLPAARDPPTFPPLPRRPLGCGCGASSSPLDLTFCAAETNQWSRKAYISSGTLCAMTTCWSSSLESLIAASIWALNPDAIESRSLFISAPGTASACLSRLRKMSNISGSVMASESRAVLSTASVTTGWSATTWMCGASTHVGVGGRVRFRVHRVRWVSRKKKRPGATGVRLATRSRRS